MWLGCRIHLVCLYHRTRFTWSLLRDVLWTNPLRYRTLCPKGEGRPGHSVRPRHSLFDEDNKVKYTKQLNEGDTEWTGCVNLTWRKDQSLEDLLPIEPSLSDLHPVCSWCPHDGHIYSKDTLPVDHYLSYESVIWQTTLFLHRVFSMRHLWVLVERT